MLKLLLAAHQSWNVYANSNAAGIIAKLSKGYQISEAKQKQAYDPLNFAI